MDSTRTPEQLQQAAHALEIQAAYRTRPDLLAVHVRGDDRLTWLNGQITNDVRQIPPGGSVHALAVNVKGKIMAELWVADLGESLLVLMPRSAADTLLESLEHFIIMEDVTLERADDLSVLSLEGPRAAELAKDIAAPDTLQFAWSPVGLSGHAWIGAESALDAVTKQLEPHAARAVPEAYELVRLRHAAPSYGVDYDEHHYPQEAGLKSLVSFNKGCYLGQEVVCTLENRGRLSRQLWVLESALDAPPAVGTPLHLAEGAATAEPVGAITSAVWDPEQKRQRALGYVRRVHAAQGASVRAGTQTLTLVRLVGEAEAPT